LKRKDSLNLSLSFLLPVLRLNGIHKKREEMTGSEERVKGGQQEFMNLQEGKIYQVKETSGLSWVIWKERKN